MRLAGLVLGALLAQTVTAELLEFTPAELRAIERHGPWPPAPARDPSNRVSGNPQAIALGERLFFDPGLSGDGTMACASCHRPAQAWTDGRRLPQGRAVPGDARLVRNTPSLWNAATGRWFGWGGGSDTIWSFSLRPIHHPLEMSSNAARVASRLRDDAELACRYRGTFGTLDKPDDALLVDAAKAIAAFVETLVSGRTAFDEFRDALLRGDRAAAARYPLAAQRGLRIFVGAGSCSICHFGPAFTNGEFGDIGVPFFVPSGVDRGRYGAIERLRADPYNLLGRYSDASDSTVAARTRHVVLQPRNFGEFKVPGLRNVAKTAPYMHNGSLSTLAAVVRHYSELNEDRLHSEGEKILRPLRLSPQASADLVAFLESLSDTSRYVSGATSPCVSPRAR